MTAANRASYVTGLLAAERRGYKAGLRASEAACPYKRADMRQSWEDGYWRGYKARRPPAPICRRRHAAK